MEPEKPTTPSSPTEPIAVVTPVPASLPDQIPITSAQPVVASVSEQPQAKPKSIMSSNSVAYKKRKPTLLIIILFVIAGLLAFGGYKFYSYQRQQPITYSKGDMEFHTTTSYELQTPQSWTQLANDSAFVKYQLECHHNCVNDVKSDDLQVYAHKLKGTNNEGADSSVAAGSVKGPISEADIKAVINNPELRKNLETSLKSSNTDQDCESVNNTTYNFMYNTKRFPIEYVQEYDCIYTSENKIKFGTQSTHVYAIGGIKGSRLYFYFLVNEENIWAKNQAYFKSIADTFKPH